MSTGMLAIINEALAEPPRQYIELRSVGERPIRENKPASWRRSDPVTYLGETRTVEEWVKKNGLSLGIVSVRIKDQGMTLVQACTTPKMKKWRRRTRAA